MNAETSENWNTGTEHVARAAPVHPQHLAATSADPVMTSGAAAKRTPTLGAVAIRQAERTPGQTDGAGS